MTERPFQYSVIAIYKLINHSSAVLLTDQIYD